MCLLTRGMSAAAMANQGVDPAANPQLPDIFTHLAFGGNIKAAGLTGGGLTLAGKALKRNFAAERYEAWQPN